MSYRPPFWWPEDYQIARRRKLFLGAEFERGALVQGDLFVGPGTQQIVRSGKICKLESYLERERAALRPTY